MLKKKTDKVAKMNARWLAKKPRRKITPIEKAFYSTPKPKFKAYAESPRKERPAPAPMKEYIKPPRGKK